MAKIQLRQKKRFSALGTKPVKKTEGTSQGKEEDKPEANDGIPEKPELKDGIQEKPEECVKDEKSEATPVVNSAATYKQTMVPNSVRKRLRAEKRAAKGQSDSGKIDTTDTDKSVSVEETTSVEPTRPKRFGNLFNLDAVQKEEPKEEPKVDIIKPQAIGEEVRPLTSQQNISEATTTHVESLDSSSRAKNRSKDREFENLANNNIQEFSVDAFTEESERLKAEGKLDEYKRPLTAIGGGKHQITSLLRQAQDNKEQLEASYSQNRLTQKESGAKYGF